MLLHVVHNAFLRHFLALPVWNGLMYYTSGMFEVDDSYQRCEKAYGDFLGEGCGGPTISVLFHVLWMVFGQYTLYVPNSQIQFR